MTKRTRNVLLTFAAFFCVVFVGVCVFRRTPLGHVLWPPRYAPSVSDVPVFTTPPPYNNGMLRLDLRARTVSVKEEGVILITRGETWGTLPDVPKDWPVCRYDAGTRTLSRVDPSQWKNAGGPIAKDGGGSAIGGFRKRQVDGVYKYQVGPGPLRDFESHGRFALRPSASPDGTILALMTADGPRRPSSGPGMVFGSFGGGFYGQHYIEFFHLPDMKPVGKPVRIPFTTIKGIDTPCWSADGRFLVYANEKGTQMCVIHVGQEGQEP